MDATTDSNAQEVLQRIRFGLQVQEQIAALRSDPVAWADYLAEAEALSR